MVNTANSWRTQLLAAYAAYFPRVSIESGDPKTVALERKQFSLLRDISYGLEYLQKEKPDASVGATAQATYHAWLDQAAKNHTQLTRRSDNTGLAIVAVGVVGALLIGALA